MDDPLPLKLDVYMDPVSLSIPVSKLLYQLSNQESVKQDVPYCPKLKIPTEEDLKQLRKGTTTNGLPISFGSFGPISTYERSKSINRPQIPPPPVKFNNHVPVRLHPSASEIAPHNNDGADSESQVNQTNNVDGVPNNHCHLANDDQASKVGTDNNNDNSFRMVDYISSPLENGDSNDDVAIATNSSGESDEDSSSSNNYTLADDGDNCKNNNTKPDVIDNGEIQYITLNSDGEEEAQEQVLKNSEELMLIDDGEGKAYFNTEVPIEKYGYFPEANNKNDETGEIDESLDLEAKYYDCQTFGFEESKLVSSAPEVIDLTGDSEESMTSLDLIDSAEDFPDSEESNSTVYSAAEVIDLTGDSEESNLAADVTKFAEHAIESQPAVASAKVNHESVDFKSRSNNLSAVAADKPEDFPKNNFAAANGHKEAKESEKDISQLNTYGVAGAEIERLRRQRNNALAVSNNTWKRKETREPAEDILKRGLDIMRRIPPMLPFNMLVEIYSHPRTFHADLPGNETPIPHCCLHVKDPTKLAKYLERSEEINEILSHAETYPLPRHFPDERKIYVRFAETTPFLGRKDLIGHFMEYGELEGFHMPPYDQGSQGYETHCGYAFFYFKDAIAVAHILQYPVHCIRGVNIFVYYGTYGYQGQGMSLYPDYGECLMSY